MIGLAVLTFSPFFLSSFSPSLLWHWPQLVVCLPVMVLCSSFWAVATIFSFVSSYASMLLFVSMVKSGVHNLIAEIPSSNIISFSSVMGQSVYSLVQSKAFLVTAKAY